MTSPVNKIFGDCTIGSNGRVGNENPPIRRFGTVIDIGEIRTTNTLPIQTMKKLVKKNCRMNLHTITKSNPKHSISVAT